MVTLQLVFVVPTRESNRRAEGVRADFSAARRGREDAIETILAWFFERKGVTRGLCAHFDEPCPAGCPRVHAVLDVAIVLPRSWQHLPSPRAYGGGVQSGSPNRMSRVRR